MRMLAFLTKIGFLILMLWMGVAAVLAASAPARAGALTYTKDIALILFQNCATCHRPGEVAPFSLLTYEDARKRARQIAEITAVRAMPPWKVASHGEFIGERKLTEGQIKKLQQWAESGAKQGKAADLPPLPKFTNDWPLGKPDLVLTPPQEYKLAAEGRDVYRCYVIPTNFSEDRYVSAIDVRPGNRAVVHHVIAYLDTTGQARKRAANSADSGYETGGGIGFLPSGMLGGWAPGAIAHHLPEGTGFVLPKGADVVLETHYHRNGKPESDRTQVAVYFNRERVRHPVHIAPLVNFWFRLPPGQKDSELSASLPVPFNATLLTVFPHMHLLGRTMTVTAILPDGTRKPLVHVPDWDFNWQGFYVYKEPIKIPIGSKIVMTAHYDNSSDNPHNPNNPPKAVGWGEQTSDEMCLAFLGFTIDGEAPPPMSLLRTTTVTDGVTKGLRHAR